MAYTLLYSTLPYPTASLFSVSGPSLSDALGSRTACVLSPVNCRLWPVACGLCTLTHSKVHPACTFDSLADERGRRGQELEEGGFKSEGGVFSWLPRVRFCKVWLVRGEVC